MSDDLTISLEADGSYVDLHSHTNESDGTVTPLELIQLAQQNGLVGLAITDHDTFEGYRKAKNAADVAGLHLLCAIELNSKLVVSATSHRSAHILAYFPGGTPAESFLQWLQEQRAERRERNALLAERLQHRGFDITLAEVEQRGRSLAGRPHFAKILVEKGYAQSTDDAFRRFIGEDAPTFVDRQSPRTEAVIEIIRQGGGLPVLAHPVRLNLSHDQVEEQTVERLAHAGLAGLEVCHSDQDRELQSYYGAMAKRFGLLPTGGSDFHGSLKPDIFLGSGRAGNVRVPSRYLDGLVAASVTISA